MKFVGTFAFANNDSRVALVEKRSIRLPHLNGRWNGIGGKMEIGESPVGAAMREFTEETGISVKKDNMLFIEHQRFLTGVRCGEGRYCINDEIYWYAVRLPKHTGLLRENDVGEKMLFWHVRDLIRLEGVDTPPLCPNVGYLVFKAFTFLNTPYLDLPA